MLEEPLKQMAAHRHSLADLLTQGDELDFDWEPLRASHCKRCGHSRLMCLLDTNIVPESRKLASGYADTGVVTWLSAIGRAMTRLSAITVFELE